MDTAIRLIADGLVPAIALIGAYCLLFALPKGSNRARAYGRIILAGLTALLCAKLVASLWQPDAARPFVELGVAAKAAYLDNAGFPSDHVLFSAAIAYAVWFETKQRKTAYLLFALVGLVALGRVLALVHTPLDVLGGLIFASFGALWYFTKPKTTKS
ncbi:MAG: phosphatase PAP2 family protein [Patescibacteria group bacterium]